MSKLLVITPVLTGGGSEKMLTEYARLAAESNIDVTLLSTSKCNVVDNHELYPFKIDYLNKEKVMLSFFSLAKYILSLKPDVILVSHLRVSLLIAILKIFRIYKEIIVVRSENLLAKEISYGELPQYYLWVRKFSYFFSDFIISQTHSMSEEIKKHLPSSRKKITILYNFLDSSFCEKKEKRKKGKNNTFVFVGRLSHQKNVGLIIDAIAYLRNKGEYFSVNILGRGPDEEMLKLKVDHLDLNKYVKFLGYQDNSIKYIENSQALLLSSYYEGLPNVMLEALWIGVPVLTTRCFGNEDRYIKNGRTGYICETFQVEEYAELMLRIRNENQKGPWDEVISLLLNDKHKAKSFLKSMVKERA
jgi:glycosyltransferase involved in cell wall biosynthesis